MTRVQVGILKKTKGDKQNDNHRNGKRNGKADSGVRGIQGHLKLYSFVINSPSDHLDKVEKIINLVFENPRSLKYRDQFAVKP